MRSHYAWRYAGDAVEIQLGKVGEDRSVMLHTLPALWQRRGQKRTDADVVSLDSPVRKKTKPNPEVPLSIRSSKCWQIVWLLLLSICGMRVQIRCRQPASVLMWISWKQQRWMC